MNLFDASALLCFLGGEAGTEIVEAQLARGGACSAANWSETAQKVSQRGGDWQLARALLLGYGLVVEPVTMVDAESAAGLWATNPSLSLGDRLCLAQAARLDAVVWTADLAWGSSESIRQISAAARRGRRG